MTALASMSDEELWKLSCSGDREAFGRIVERYQSLICSLAYSACGNFAGSEDLAQETFVTAWRNLKELRDPQKLRAWLCGIVRNLSANSVRRTVRRGGDPEPLDFAAEAPASVNDPAAETVQREEEAIVWRTLGEMPASYREPLILFYREQQSVAEVATQLELTEETVKQRLSRGRSMLRSELTTLVESTLTRTRPSAAFAAGVLATLPMVTAQQAAAAVGVAAASQGTSAAVKSLLSGVGPGAVAGPLTGLFVSWFCTKLAASVARSTKERACIVRHARLQVFICFAMSVLLALALSQAGKLYPVNVAGLLGGIFAWVATLVGLILAVNARLRRRVDRIRAQAEAPH